MGCEDAIKVIAHYLRIGFKVEPIVCIFFSNTNKRRCLQIYTHLYGYTHNSIYAGNAQQAPRYVT